MRRAREANGYSEIDVRAAHARVVAPQPRQEAADESAMAGGGGRRNMPDALDAAAPTITHVPNIKQPFPLGNPPWSAGRPGDASSAARQRAAPVSAPKVCSSPDMQPSHDASSYGHVSLGPQTFSFSARQRFWAYSPPPALLHRWRGDDSTGLQIISLALIMAGMAYFCLI